MSPCYDVVIIGSGPAGSHLGFLLAKAGYKVALIDRMFFPRNKLCGGLLTQKTLELLASSHPKYSVAGFSPRFAHVFYKRKTHATFSLLSEAKIVHRYSFDLELLHAAQDQGVHTYLGNALSVVNFERKTISLHDKTTLSYQHLVGADGALSKVRHLAGLPRNLSGFCVEAFAPKDGINISEPVKDGGVGIYYGDYSSGYGWIFPNSDYVAIGVGELTNRMVERQIVESYTAFSSKILVQSSPKLFGAYIPSGNSVVLGSPTYEDMCLIGDAAGLIDPITGEGIYYALLSAEMAAKAIQSAAPSYPKYVQNMSETVERIHDGCQIRDKIYAPHVLKNTISSIQAAPQYFEQLIDETIMRYTKTYHEAYEDIKFLSR